MYGWSRFSLNHSSISSLRCFGLSSEIIRNVSSGRAGADFLVGAEGNDTLWGGAGGDLLHGGAGQDVFAFGRGDGYDRVLDLVPGQDRLSLSSSLPQIAGLSAGDIVLRFGAGDGTDSWLDFGGGDRLLIRGIADPGLLAGDIVLG